MGFGTFLKQVGKVAFGYGLGFLLSIAGIMTYSFGNTGTGAVLFIVGAVLVLFGVYSEKGL